MTRISARASALVIVALASTACGTGGGSITPHPFATRVAPAPSPSSGAQMQTLLRFVWPARPIASANIRGRSYVSPSIASLTIAVDGAAPVVETAPMPTGSPVSVTYSLDIAPGNHSLTIGEFDASSKLLGSATSPLTIVANTQNTIGFTLDGNLATIAIVPTGDPFLEGTRASGFVLVGDRAQTFTAIPEDADGNRIIAPGAIPNITTMSANATIVDTDLGNDTFSLAAPAPTAAQTITASGKNLDGATVTTRFAAGALAAYYVTNYTSQTVGVYDQNGTALTVAPTAFANLQNPGGIAYVPSGTIGVAGALVITQTADSSVPSVVKYDTAGNLLPLASASFSGTAEPLFLGYGVVGTTPTLAIPSENSSSVELFDLAGNALPTALGAFSKLDNPVQILYDAHDANYYATNLGSASINRYSSTGAPIKTGVSAGNATMGEAFDTNSDEIFVTYQGNAAPGQMIGGRPVTAGAQIAKVIVFDESLATVAQATNAFLPPTTTAFYADIAFDPYQKQLYVTDAGDNTIVAFTEAGASVTLPSGAFANLSDPMSIAIVP